jgi:zinc/manganese transport system substrate-binding protein
MTVRTRRATLAVVGMATFALAQSACGSGQAVSGGSEGKIKVVASTDVWGSVVRAVGGDAVEVTAIIDDPAKDPHDYEVKPVDAAKIAAAQLVVFNGNGYDDFFTKAISAAGQGKQTVNAYDVSGKPKGEGSNPHIFYDLPSVKKVADQVAKDLGAIQADKAATFTANAKQFDAKVDELLAKVTKIGTDHPGKQVVVTEPVADYLLKSAGVQDATPQAFEQAVEAGSDIPVAAVGQANDLITNKQVAALVNNAQTETEITKQLKTKATAAGVPIVDVTETLPAGAGDYLEWIGKEIDALSNAVVK